MDSESNKSSFYPYFDLKQVKVIETDKDTNLPTKVSLFGNMLLPVEKILPFLKKPEFEGFFVYPRNGVLFTSFEFNYLKDPSSVSTAMFVQQVADFIKADSFTMILEENTVWFHYTLTEEQSKELGPRLSGVQELKNEKQKLTEELRELNKKVYKKQDEIEKLEELIGEKVDKMNEEVFDLFKKH
jgi:hypothetical protein